MRRLFAIFTAILTFLTATAQVEYSIILDKSTFHKVQTDPLSGVNIDPIKKDLSRNPCARLKIKFKDMSRAEVDALAVKFKSNTDIARQEVAQYFDDVLILEVTAKPATRFYVKSPEYGESNEVSVGLEGNCEYEMEARLNQSFSIVVDTNVAEADVYLDGYKKERTDASCRVTIKEVMIGEHTIKVDYKGVTAEQKVVVNGDNISFRVNVDTAASEPQYVAFEVTPANALVEIDNKQYTPEEGVVVVVLNPGTYNYSVSARFYHTHRDTFVVAGSKVERKLTLLPAFGYLSVGGGALEGATVFVDNENIGTAPVKSDKLASGEHSVRIVKSKYKPYVSTVVIADNQTKTINPTLAPDFATVTLTAPGGAAIWVNGVQKGTGSWTGELSTGTYIFETRKDGHRSQKITKSISATPARQSYNLAAPTPIMGGADITSSPAMADIYIDGKHFGSTPLKINNLLVGKHTLLLSRKGYTNHTQTVTITEGKTTTVTATLTKQSTPTPTPATTSQPGSYKIGDIVTINGVQGIVFQTSPVVKIVSVAETKAEWGEEYGVATNARDTDNGKANMTKIKSISGWQSKYPAFKWCADLGDGWYLPAFNELKAIYNQKDVINKILSANGFDRLGSKDSYSYIWSSSADVSDGAYGIDFSDGNGHYFNKISFIAVRAVLALDGSSSTSIPTPKPTPTTPSQSGSYKIGDIVTVKGVKGVVFQTSPVVKIVSVAETTAKWGTEYEVTNARDKDNGKANMTKIKSISGWQSKYPAFKWCADLGDGWYLPAQNELKAIYNQKDVINKTLSANGFDRLGSKDSWLWSSSEGYSGLAYSVYFSNGDVYDDAKNNNNAVRAVFVLDGRETAVISTPASKPTTPKPATPSSTGKTYKVGDYYNEHGKEGVVFEVTDGGRHGKIVSMKRSKKRLQWSSDSYEQRRLIGANSKTDGAYNMSKVKAVSGWQSKYPSFKWCADLGDGWYLPAKEELLTIYKYKVLINDNLRDKLTERNWSSTEENVKYLGEFCAWIVDMDDGGTTNLGKFSDYYVRAVSAF